MADNDDVSFRFAACDDQDRGPIVIVHGDKGGVGKSFVTRVTAGWLLKNGARVYGFDGDARNPHLARYYEHAAADGSSGITVVRAMLRSTDGWAEMYMKWESIDPSATILVDLPGNVGDMVDAETARLPRVAESLGRPVILMWAASEEEDSVWLFRRARSLAPPRQTLFVMNGRFGDSISKFELWQQSKTRAQFVADGGKETLLPVLPIYPRTSIARARTPFNLIKPGTLNLIEWIDFDLWWADVEIALQPLFTMLRVS